jgi:hypothetical protein
MLEEAINAQESSLNGVQVNYSQNDKDGVFQLTTLSALPLKSPKRLIALQLANNNPAFRERFRQKLEQSGGPLITGSQSHHQMSSAAMSDFSNNILGGGSMWPHQVGIPNHGTLQLDDQGNYTMLTDGDIEKFMQSPDMVGWVNSDSSTSESYGKKHGESCLSESKLHGKKDQQNSSKKETKRGRGKGKAKEDEGGEERITASTTKRKGRRKDDNSFGDTDNMTQSGENHSQDNMGAEGSSIIKRRRKGELQIMVDGGLGFGGHVPGPLTNAIKNNTNLHSLLGGGISDMGPPGETPRRSNRLKSGGLPSTLSNLNTSFNYLESPFLDKALVDMFSTFGDTPSRLMHLDPPLSKTANTTTGDAIRFDFDEAVAGHFPSPRAGEHLKGSSPSRWSGGSASSMASFSFPEGLLSTRSSGAGLQDNEQNAQEGQQQSIYAKKFKKAHKLDSRRDSTESNSSSDPAAQDDALLQSPEPMAAKTTGSSTKVFKAT